MINTQLVWKKNFIPNLRENLKIINTQSVKYGFFEGTGIHSESGFNAPTLMGMHELRLKKDVPRREPLKESIELMTELTVGVSIGKEVSHYVMGFKRRRNVTEARQMLSNIGNKGANIVKSIFGDTSILTTNTTATAARKGFNKPLIEFGELVSHVAYKTSMNKKVVRAR